MSGTILNTVTVCIDEGELDILGATDSFSDFDADEELELECCFYSYPYCPTITWYKDGVEIKDGLTTRKIKQGRTLQIFPKMDTGGNYTCTAITPYGEVESHTIRNVQVISKFYPRANGAKRRARVLIPLGCLPPGKRKH